MRLPADEYEEAPTEDEVVRNSVTEGGNMTFEVPRVVDFGSIAQHTFAGDKSKDKFWWHGLS